MNVYKMRMHSHCHAVSCHRNCDFNIMHSLWFPKSLISNSSIFLGELKQTTGGKKRCNKSTFKIWRYLCVYSQAKPPYTISLDLLAPSMSGLVRHGGVTPPGMATARGIWHSCWESGTVGRGAVRPLSLFLSHFEVWVIHKNVNSITAFMWLQVEKENDCQVFSRANDE